MPFALIPKCAAPFNGGGWRRALNTRSEARTPCYPTVATSSDLLPPPEKDFIADAIRTVTDPKSPYYARLLEGTVAHTCAELRAVHG